MTTFIFERYERRRKGVEFYLSQPRVYKALSVLSLELSFFSFNPIYFTQLWSDPDLPFSVIFL